MIHQRQWATRHNDITRDLSVRHCVCANPKPFKDGMGLRLFGTVECAKCHRAMFADGKAVRS